MSTHIEKAPIDHDQLTAIVDKAAHAIPPAWPLSATVAVNPFLGQSDADLAMTSARISRVTGASLTMPRDWYQTRIENGEITDEDLASALASSTAAASLSVADIKEAASKPAPQPALLPTVADLAAKASKTDWPGLIDDRFGAWAAGYFDAGQALWSAPQKKTAYAAWRAVATHDLTPEIAGLEGFATHVADAPEGPEEMLKRAIEGMGLGEAMLETYFHRLLMSLGGWAQFARYRLWQAELAEKSDDILLQLLAIRIAWDEALFAQHEKQIGSPWQEAKTQFATEVEPTRNEIINGILQEASERAGQRSLIGTIEGSARETGDGRPVLQAAFCIDVRSEVFRRALEDLDPAITTLGFAGFFGLATSHQRFASDVDELRLPVLLNPGVSSHAHANNNARAEDAARLTARAKRAWGRFKLAAVSSFAFVEAAGPVYAGELVRDALGLASASPKPEPAPRFSPELDLETRLGAAETVLRAMTLTGNFARVIILAGHGSHVVNNPHASALQCGACGGYSGDVNARLLAGLLNDDEVRTGLIEKGIEIPADTIFLAALHDTATDKITLYTDDQPMPDHGADLKKIRAWLDEAGRVTRRERALRLPRAEDGSCIPIRSRDWAEVRPEWALAGCRAFIAASRRRTSGKDLQGRAFLHDYSWRDDEGFGVLELIMTAPVVVASWISLQYYGSSVAPDVFGSGNKLLHNVTGGIGVVEGNGGQLRAGLPWQSVHDGEKLIHDPLRLTVFIEAPIEAMTDILDRHEGVRALFDNKWLHLMGIDSNGKVHARYAGDLEWESLRTKELAAA